MTLVVDLYYTMRSPYCYLATPELLQLTQSHDLHFNLKIVYPLAVSDDTFFKRVNPMWPRYLQKDTARTAERLKIPFLWPRPDPIVQDMKTREVKAEQPYITRLTHLAQLAAEDGKGLEYVVAVSALLYSPHIDSWIEGDNLKQAMADAGFELDEMDAAALAEAGRLEAAAQQNRQDQLAAGHWGAPLFVHDGEIFFGRDRIDDLVFHLTKHGLTAR